MEHTNAGRGRVAGPSAACVVSVPGPNDLGRVIGRNYGVLGTSVFWHMIPQETVNCNSASAFVGVECRGFADDIVVNPTGHAPVKPPRSHGPVEGNLHSLGFRV